MRSWLPEGVDGLEERESAHRLADSWLQRFGPATLADLQWWTGWTGKTTQEALTDCGAEQVELDGQVGWVAAGDVHAPQDPGERWEALLPGLDPTTMGWKQRDWYLPAEAVECFDRNGNAGPTIWVDGQVVGAWAQARDGQIRTHWFAQVPSERRERVLQRAEELRSWLGSTRFSVRFPGRVNASLLAGTATGTAVGTAAHRQRA